MAQPLISVKADFSEFEKAVDNIQKRQIPFALRLSLVDTMKGAREALKKNMAAKFDRPTPYVLNSLRYEVANKTARTVSGIKLPPFSGMVWTKSRFDAAKATVPPENIIRPNVFGGNRKHKRFELALQRRGLMPRGWYIVPGQGADIDAYGNMSRGQIVQILAYFRAFGEQGFRANSTDKTRARLKRGTTARAKRQRRGLSYFISTPKEAAARHLTPGIYKKTFFAFGTAIKPVVIFVKRARYSVRFDFFGIARRYAERNFRRNFQKRFARALETAR